MDIVEEKKRIVMDYLNIKNTKDVFERENNVFHYPCRFYVPNDQITFDVFTETERDYLVSIVISHCLETNNFYFTIKDIVNLLDVPMYEVEEYISKEKTTNKENFYCDVYYGENLVLTGVMGGLSLSKLVERHMDRLTFYKKLFGLYEAENRIGSLLATYDHREIKFNGFYFYRIA